MKNSVRNTQIMLGFMITMGLLASCAQPAEIPAERVVEEATPAAATPTPTVQQVPEDDSEDLEVAYECEVGLPGGPEWPVLVCETFADNRLDWQLESQDNPYARYTSEISEGQFQVDYNAKMFTNFGRSVITWFDVGDAHDFAISVSGLMDTRMITPGWGVAFRADDEMESFYLFTIYNDSSYAFDFFENQKWIPLIGRRPHNIVQLGQMNKVTILAEDTDFTFYINDQLINTFEGVLRESSAIYLLVTAGEGANVRFAFEDVVLQRAP